MWPNSGFLFYIEGLYNIVSNSLFVCYKDKNNNQNAIECEKDEVEPFMRGFTLSIVKKLFVLFTDSC